MPEKILGLDIGAGSVKAVLLSRGFFGAHRILGVRRIDIRGPGGVPEALALLFADPVYEGATCVTALPADRISFRNVRLPFRGDRRIRQTLAFALEPLIHQPLDSVFIDYLASPQDVQSEIFAALADRSLVGEWTELLSPHTRETAVIDVGAAPLAAFLLRKSDSHACTLVLDVGLRDTTALFTAESRICHIRHFHFGGEKATQAVAETLRMDTAAAEALKKAGDIPEPAAASVRAVCDLFLSELKNTQRFLFDQGRIPSEISRIILTGGGALTPGLAERLSRVFAVCVEGTDLITSGNYEMEHALSSSWEPAILDQALALATRPMGKGRGFNFRQRESVMAGFGGPNGFLKKGAAAIVLILILAGIELGLDDYAARLRLAGLKSKIAAEFQKMDPEATRIVDPVIQLRGKIAEAKKLASGMDDANTATRAIDLLREISVLAPPDLHVTSLTLDGNEVGLRGEIRDPDGVDSVRQTFAGSKYVETATIGERSPMKQGTGVAFHLRMILKK